MEKLGVIGGLGPAATACFMTRVIEFTDVSRDQDHLDITILNRPQIPDRTAFLLGEPGAESFVPPMNEAALQLEELGCTVLGTPCNTAHACLADISEGLENARFVNMLTETSRAMDMLGCKTVGVLATDGTCAAHVYDDALAAEGIIAVWPDDEHQSQVMEMIFDQVKAGFPIDEKMMGDVCLHMAEKGCDGVVLGCTELSIGSDTRAKVPIPVISALDVLAWACVRECGAPVKDLFEMAR